MFTGSPGIENASRLTDRVTSRIIPNPSRAYIGALVEHVAQHRS
jgi:hypothetical protein